MRWKDEYTNWMKMGNGFQLLFPLVTIIIKETSAKRALKVGW